MRGRRPASSVGLGWTAGFVDLAVVVQVAVNLPTSGWDVHMPSGGFGESGSPFKEQALDALRFYSRAKTVAVYNGS